MMSAFPPADDYEPTLDPAEIEITPVTTPDDITGIDRRNSLDGMADIPALPPIGLIDASTDASTRVANVLIDPEVDVSLDTFVVSAQRLADGSSLFHYGIVPNRRSESEGSGACTYPIGGLDGERSAYDEPVAWLAT